MRGTPLVQLSDIYPVRASQYAGRRIARRSFYVMQGDLVVAASSSRSFDPSTFLNNQQYPFEITTMLPQITCLDASLVPIVDPSISAPLTRWVQLQMKFQGIARDITKANTRLSAILPADSKELNFTSPIYLEKAEGFDIAITNAITSGNAAGGIRMEIGFLGNLIEFES